MKRIFMQDHLLLTYSEEAFVIGQVGGAIGEQQRNFVRFGIRLNAETHDPVIRA